MSMYFMWASFLLFGLSIYGRVPQAQKGELPLVVIITSYNNNDWYRRNLDSVFSQNYHNYRVIYVDDASSDGTGEHVELYIKEKKQEHRTVLIRNKEWVGGMANHYLAAHMCDDHEIIVHLDGDDWLAHPGVLTLVNDIYMRNGNVWITYGGAEWWPSGGNFLNLSLSRLASLRINENNVRQAPFLYSHLRTFRAWLFKKVKLEDLTIASSFAPVAPSPDTALMLPMLEMAGADHVYEIPPKPPVYIWNQANPISQHRLSATRQWELGLTIYSWPQYARLMSHKQELIKNYMHSKVCYMLFVSDRTVPLLKPCLASLRARVQGIGKIIVIYGPSSKKTDVYRKLVQAFPRTTLIRYSPAMRDNFPLFLSELIQQVREEHIVLAVPTVGAARECNLTYCIRELERTYAYGFYLTLQEDPRTTCIRLSENLRAWHLTAGSNVWSYPNSLGAVLYRKKDIIEKLREMYNYSVIEFITEWSYQDFAEKTLGLFFVTSPMKKL